MDALSSASAGMLANSLEKQSFNAQLVSKTLDYMNMGSGMGAMSSKNADYDFQTNVLSAAFTGKGAIANMNV